MSNKKPDTQSVGKIHKILLDDSVRTGVRTSAVAQDDKGMRIGVLPLHVFLPYPCEVVADELGRVVAGSERHIANILGHVIDAVRNDLAIRECREVVVEGLEWPVGQRLAFPLEVSQHLLLLGVDADDRKSDGLGLFADGGDMLELLVPVLNLLHGKVLIEGTLPKIQGIKDLTDIVAGNVVSGLLQLVLYLRDTQGYPHDIFVLRQACRVRLDDLHHCFHPLRMKREFTLPACTLPADAAVAGTFSAEEFLETIVKSMCACSHNFANFAVAEPLSLEVRGLGRQEPSSVSLVQRGHIRQIAWRKDFWRNFRYHYKSLAITLKVTKISPVFLYYIIDNQQIKSNFCRCFGGSFRDGFPSVLNTMLWSQMAA